MNSDEIQNMIDDCISERTASNCCFNAWEKEFIDSIVHQWQEANHLSPKQQECLEEIREAMGKISKTPWIIASGSGTCLCTGIFSDDKNKDGKSIWVADCLSDLMLSSKHAADNHVPNMQFIASAPEYISFLLAEVEKLQNAIPLTSDFCIEKKYIKDIADEKLKEENVKLQEELTLLRKVLVDALEDNYFGDHSSGCWQKDARKALNINKDEDDGDEYFEALQQARDKEGK